MDRISQLPDTLLLRILSELPTAKDVVATMVLSKRWLPLWKSVPKLVFKDDIYQNINDTGRFSRFVHRSLILHKAPLETLCFQLTQTSSVVDIGIWIEMALQRGVRDLSIDIDCTSSTTPVTLPRSLYTGCGILVTLILKSVTLVDSSSLPSFSTLKTLNLLSVKYPGDEFVKRLLLNCHVLEDLHVEQCLDDNVTAFTVRVPSLKSALLDKTLDRGFGEDDGFVIDAPSLELLDVLIISGSFCIIENDMPNIDRVSVVLYHDPWKILWDTTSVKRLSLCVPYSKASNPVGLVFHRLVRLEMCTSEPEWFSLLMFVLRASPNLRALKLQRCCIRGQELFSFWNEPSLVPECLLSSIKTFEWVDYEGTIEEKEVVAFILRSGRCLKKVNISSATTDSG
ncbi:unnamed protein product [Eruca vesicaria subsp. sativa]|uniref:FBD domain-containing protein n=1 Tax=Eruca vesicaria subsp. sativa TaxID=29727 RepID=A0ABC8J192_ERUVS|nr:unnamed protein product [Eruca vesicaria subsp. sativa]